MPPGANDQPAASPGASELMRSLGLLVDGPQVWGAPVHSRNAGVFLVELPGAADHAPLDTHALRQWLERVPELRLDGEPATPPALAARLAQFWLPGEPVLYVGRSAKSIGARVAALYATPLGDARPHAGGHWLKTLSVLARLRIWWAETDAHEEYEDALLTAVAERTPADVVAQLPDQNAVLPFANLVTSSRRTKPHGLENALREPAESRPAKPGTTAASPRAAAPRRASPFAPPRSRAAGRRTTDSPPSAPPTYISQDGLDRLQVELEELRTQVRPVVIERVKTARELGDLRENSEYESARREQSFVEGRIQMLEGLVRSATVLEAPATTDGAGVGSTVVVELDGEEQTFVLVGSSEADPAAGRISYSSPVGRVLLGRRAGEEVTARLPRGEIRCRVVEVR
ncbi:MAG TPA: transcription elongation factor GreA [Candidatus Caenarcaniphilales bacterium]|nr:transcription elongation factor GreA [Candidatus Caenarcaniphilales bacterium]